MKLILHFLKPYRWLCVFTILAMLLDVAGGLLVPRLTADMINIGVESGSLDYMIRKGIAMLAVTVFSGAGALLGSWLCADLSAKIGEDMRNAVYEKSLTFSAHDFEQFSTGSMITRTLNDINIIQQSVVWCIQMVLPVPAVCIMGVGMAFAIDTVMGFLLIGVTALIIVLALLVTRKASEIFGRLQRLLDRMNVVLRENLTGVRVIRAFNKEKDEERRMRKNFEDYAETAVSANLLFAGLESTAFFVINIAIVAILWIGGNRIGAGFMEIGDITALTEYSILILFYIIMAQMVIILLPRARVCIGRIREVLEKEPEIKDGEGRIGPAGNPEDKEAGCPADAGWEAASFSNVTFRFPDADENALTDLSFTCRKGETTAVIGGTGSGKSTIAKLFLRFHDVTEGTVRVGGADVRDISQNELRSRISYVPQKAWLFSGTIADNLGYGSENASEEEMRRILAVAQADFVSSLANGLDSHVAQGGTNYSGGQKQRLSIARALMKKADLYIFDDSFSALDFKTDAALRKALKEEVADAAVLIIAQRINTILNADQIIVLDEGRIVGIGRHEELMENCPVYREIARSQMKGGGEVV
ncbi:MAG TPA: ABC transporter ATP-binding protein/permease [Candidatus Mediterraneibacter faecigallinarum]|uniref:ABC transporter ATP-binding protein/permease n=1 Tax=Candidatus Mediterraneibacter faecigallinarum TaxID=2838669 RepID=A0A9D2NZC1_9FIRM|nr:ABC transporter ATP-binding protein/permease [Candidatus Mediterraneibacter faecigallinarum]